MSPDDLKGVFRDYVGVWESGRIEGLLRIVHPAYVGHASWGDRDIDGLRDRILVFREMFREPRFQVEDQLVEGDKVASRMTATAIRAADGEKVVLYGLNISRIVDRRIAEEWMAWEIQPAIVMVPRASG